MADALDGPDWECGSCGNVNAGGENTCAGCGSSRAGEADGDRTMPVHAYGVGQAPSSAAEALALDRAEAREKAARRRESRTGGASVLPCDTESGKGDRPSSVRSGAVTPRRGWIAGTAALLVAFLASLFITWSVPAEVTGGQWRRTVDVERMVRVTEEGWDVPAGGTVIDRDWRFRTTREVPDGTRTVMVDEQVQTGTRSVNCGVEDLGNGFFRDKTCSEPVYATRQVSRQMPAFRTEPVHDHWFTWEIDRWTVARTLVAEGGLDSDPTWPVGQIADRSGLGGERLATRRESYGVELLAEGRSRTVKVAPDEFGRAALNQVRMRRNIWGHASGLEFSP